MNELKILLTFISIFGFLIVGSYMLEARDIVVNDDYSIEIHVDDDSNVMYEISTALFEIEKTMHIEDTLYNEIIFIVHDDEIGRMPYSDFLTYVKMGAMNKSEFLMNMLYGDIKSYSRNKKG